MTVPAEPGGDLDVELVEADRLIPRLDEVLVASHLADLEHRIEVARAVLDRLVDLEDAQRDHLADLDRAWRDYRQQPGVDDALRRYADRNPHTRRTTT